MSSFLLLLLGDSLLLNDLALIPTNLVGPDVKTTGQREGTGKHQSLLHHDGNGHQFGNLGRGNLIVDGVRVEDTEHQGILGDHDQGEDHEHVREGLKDIINEGKRECGRLEDGKGHDADNVNSQVGGVEGQGRLG